ncbi:MAG: neutral/alkaline non-lysosomal ceramidase N-terminal domain-containing protein [Candidatus Bathyarchaeia archaeon]
MGLSKVTITPPIGVRLSGYADRIQPSIGILDDLYARALVIDDGEERAAIVICDLLGLTNSLVKDIRSRVRELTGIEDENIMVTATHTHCGPDLRFAGEAYIESLKSQVAGAVYAACNNMREVRIGVGRGECFVGCNRRNPKSPYGPYYLYSWPEGPMDPTVLVLRIEDLSGRILGILINYSCHPVTLGPRELRISRDYPGYALEVLEKIFGRDIVAIFMNGFCGNINPNWIWDKPELSPPPPRSFPESLEERLKETRRLGHILGAEALKVAESITNFISETRLKVKRKELSLPVRKDIPERMLKFIRESKPNQLNYERYQKILKGEDILTEVQAIAINDIAIVGCPGEVFVEFQLEIRRRSPYKYTFLSELANDSIGYLPVASAYDEGGYEPTATVLAREAGEKLTKAAIELLMEISHNPS